MSKFYIINGAGPSFDGVLVEGDPIMEDTFNDGVPADTGLVEVVRFIETDVVIGDRQFSTPVTPGSLFMSTDFLEEVEDPKLREFDSKNPYGKFQLEGRMKCGPIEVAYSQYERCLQVNVMEVIDAKDMPMVPGATLNKTLLAVNFTKDFDKVKSLIESSLKNQDDADQLVFKLEELRDNG